MQNTMIRIEEWFTANGMDMGYVTIGAAIVMAITLLCMDIWTLSRRKPE